MKRKTSSTTRSSEGTADSIVFVAVGILIGVIAYVVMVLGEKPNS